MSAALDTFATAREMLAALRERRVAAADLLALHVARIERYDKALNAVVVRDFERARQSAEAADRALIRGDRRPLLGLPVTLKESINVAGLATTVGSPAWSTFVSQDDAPVAERVRAAGVVLMGKTNVPPLLADWQANNAVYGRTNNPWDVTRAPGGSSGGGAAAVAAGLTPLDYGSDIGGSIRVPAAFCGVYGHKPSETTVPHSGQFPRVPTPNPGNVMSVQGPLARSAEDLELALDVIAGPEIGEEVAWRIALPPARRERLGDFRVAVLPPVAWLPVDGEILDAQQRVVDVLARAGARVGVAQPETLGDLREHHAVYLRLLTAVVSARVTPEERRRRVGFYRAAGDEFSLVRAGALEAGAADFVGWLYERERHRVAFRAFFRDWDVLLTPAFGSVAFPHVDFLTMDEAQVYRHPFTVADRTTPYEWQLGYPAVATLSGQPATAVPVGRTNTGLPVGLQAIGPYLEDRTPIRFAALLAREIGGYARPPGFA